MKEKVPLYIASIVVLRNPLRYVISTNAGMAMYSSYDDLPQMCKDFLKLHLNNALNVSENDLVLVGTQEVDIYATD